MVGLVGVHMTASTPKTTAGAGQPLNVMNFESLARSALPPAWFGYKLLGQIHLPQERLVTRVGCKILEQRLADDFDETRVLLFVRTFEPLKCKIVIIPVGIIH